MKQHVYIVWSHPRRNSLTAQMVHSLRQRAEARGAHVTELDLYRSDFDPVLRVEDEPEWGNPDKRYSPEVHRLFAELDNQDIIFFVFPVWWYSFPAMLKGYLERVWNYGLAYGEQNRLTAKTVRWLALAGGSHRSFIKYGWEKNITDHLLGVSAYLAIRDVDVHFLYNTLGVEEAIQDDVSHYAQLFEQMYAVVDSTV
ncbi:putative NADPH-quinone reductase [Pantoea sp. PNA 14-12]|uniref:NAD(P)H oxidoreductase n=1 Tax=Pantoea TaxID=53335 RepID=UPI00050E67D9|nr:MULTISPECIES: NAD(P)H oxidoreductase [Pantoea]KGD83940.1 hypothetical protein HA47_09315 [Pantoea stewartii subsp. indologenes]MEB6532990.1 NAD(P)H oxidoreductase [Pantoea stewartii]TDS70364.1 putative NADPH-quinone reductase [Pantoea sp. PNA 14-12]